MYICICVLYGLRGQSEERGWLYALYACGWKTTLPFPPFPRRLRITSLVTLPPNHRVSCPQHLDDGRSSSKSSGSGPVGINSGGYGRHGVNAAGGGDRPSTSGGLYNNDSSYSDSRPSTSAGLGSAGALPNQGQSRAKMLQQQRELAKKKA